jgi:hypothetical protein
MFRYFRIIRKKLIEQDNVRKYLLYAIGEVLLVVIGILIALQINNWNEDKQAKIRMLTNIISIQDDIQVEIQILGNVIQTLHSQVESAGSIVPLMESRDRIVQDSLKFILDFNRLTNTPIITRRSNTWDFLNASGDIPKSGHDNVGQVSQGDGFVQVSGCSDTDRTAWPGPHVHCFGN